MFRLLFDSDGDLWSASADGTVKGLVRGEAGGAWEVQDSLTHGDWVRDVCVTERWVVTGGREEGVRVWDRGVCVFFANSHSCTYSTHTLSLFPSSAPSPILSFSRSVPT